MSSPTVDLNHLTPCRFKYQFGKAHHVQFITYHQGFCPRPSLTSTIGISEKIPSSSINGCPIHLPSPGCVFYLAVRFPSVTRDGGLE